MDARIDYSGPLCSALDKARMRYFGLDLNFVVVTKLERTISELLPAPSLNPDAHSIHISVAEMRYFREEVPSQYQDFLQRAMFHLHYINGWLCAEAPPRKNEALHASYWLISAIDGLRSECRQVFPFRGTMAFPLTWKSQFLGSITSEYSHQYDSINKLSLMSSLE
jgi:hypothetical protein